jgi:hypothetical protein
MTDRAKKISELSTTTSVANTDKIVVLKDAANSSIASTKAMTVNNFALSIAPLLQLPGSVVQYGNVTARSNGTSYVTFFSFDGNTHFSGILNFQAKDTDSTGHYTMGSIYFVKNTAESNSINLVTYNGDNPIMIENTPVINVSTGVTELQFKRSSASTANVNIRYVVVLN